MKVSTGQSAWRVSQTVASFAGFSLAVISVLALPSAIRAQGPDRPADSKPGGDHPPEARRTFFLSNVTTANDLNDIQTDLRNMIPRARIYGVATQFAISVSGSKEDIQLAEDMIRELDRPRKVYRLTYTFTDVGGGKRGASQQYTLIAVQGERSQLVEGVKVPIVTGSYSHEGGTAESQTQFEDVGLKIESTVEGARLHTHIERSSVSEEKSGVGPEDPIIRQTALNGMTILTQGKPVVLGSLEFPDSARREEIAVAAEAVQ